MRHNLKVKWLLVSKYNRLLNLKKKSLNFDFSFAHHKVMDAKDEMEVLDESSKERNGHLRYKNFSFSIILPLLAHCTPFNFIL